MIIARFKNYKGGYLTVKGISTSIAINSYLNYRELEDLKIITIKKKNYGSNKIYSNLRK